MSKRFLGISCIDDGVPLVSRDFAQIGRFSSSHTTRKPNFKRFLGAFEKMRFPDHVWRIRLYYSGLFSEKKSKLRQAQSNAFVK